MNVCVCVYVFIYKCSCLSRVLVRHLIDMPSVEQVWTLLGVYHPHSADGNDWKFGQLHPLCQQPGLCPCVLNCVSACVVWWSSLV